MAQFEASLKKAGKIDKARIKHAAKREFAKVLHALPFADKKRIVDAVIAPADGGRVRIRYPDPLDITSVVEWNEIPKEERNKPLTHMEPVVEIDFFLDLNRIEAIITGLNKDTLLNKAAKDDFARRIAKQRAC